MKRHLKTWELGTDVGDILRTALITVEEVLNLDRYIDKKVLVGYGALR